MDERIRVRCVRPMMYDGERVEPGAVLTLVPLAAVECLASGRAEFVDAADAERARAAIESANNSTLRRLSSPTDFYRIGRLAA